MVADFVWYCLLSTFIVLILIFSCYYVREIINTLIIVLRILLILITELQESFKFYVRYFFLQKYQVDGDGDHLVVVCHGLISDGDNIMNFFKAEFDELFEEHTIFVCNVYPSWIGLHYTLDEHALLLHEQLILYLNERKQLQNPFKSISFIGFSAGGIVAAKASILLEPYLDEHHIQPKTLITIASPWDGAELLTDDQNEIIRLMLIIRNIFFQQCPISREFHGKNEIQFVCDIFETVVRYASDKLDRLISASSATKTHDITTFVGESKNFITNTSSSKKEWIHLLKLDWTCNNSVHQSILLSNAIIHHMHDTYFKTFDDNI